MISFAMIYAGAAFAPKKHVIGVDGFLPALISKVLTDDVKHVELLSLVLVKSLNLDIKD